MRIITLFQFTPLREGRRLTPDEMGELTDYFNSRPSARGDAEVLYGYKAEINFNSRPSARGDARWNSNSCVKFISIHAPPRGATSNSLRASAMLLFQFTLLREGRRKGWNDAKGKAAEISIHAPPRGATQGLERCKGKGSRDFNSRPSARGDTRRRSSRKSSGNFNSRPSARGDKRCKILI